MPGTDSQDFPQPLPDQNKKGPNREEIGKTFVERAAIFISRNNGGSPITEQNRFRIQEDARFLAYETLNSSGDLIVTRSYWEYMPGREKDRDIEFDESRHLAFLREKNKPFRILDISLHSEYTRSDRSDSREQVFLDFIGEKGQKIGNLGRVILLIDNRQFIFNYDDVGEISGAVTMPVVNPLDDPSMNPEDRGLQPQYQFIRKEDIQALREGKEIPHFIPGGVITSRVINGKLNIQRIMGEKVVDIVNLPFNAPSSIEVTNNLLDQDTIDDPYDAPTSLDYKWDSFPQVMQAAGITWERHWELTRG